MAWEENSRICINMLLIAILSRTGVRLFIVVSTALDSGNLNDVVRLISDPDKALSSAMSSCEHDVVNAIEASAT